MPSYSLTTLRAGIIIGSGSASFEIIPDLVEKLPVLVAPGWIDTISQPIAVRNIIEFISGVLLNEKTFNKSFDIGGPEKREKNKTEISPGELLYFWCVWIEDKASG